MAFLGAVIGQLALAEFIKRTGRASIAVLLLGVMEVNKHFLPLPLKSLNG